MAASRQDRPTPSRLSTIVVMAVTAVTILLVTGLVNRSSASGDGLTPVTLSGPAGPPPQVGAAVPTFTATAIDGKTLSLDGLRGHPVWLTFGASWCQECRAENPDIEAAYAQFKAHGGEIVAIYISEDQSAVSDYVSRVGITYPVIADPATKVASLYGVLGVPGHFFIDSSGVLRVQKNGALDPSAIGAALAAISR